MYYMSAQIMCLMGKRIPLTKLMHKQIRKPFMERVKTWRRIDSSCVR